MVLQARRHTVGGGPFNYEDNQMKIIVKTTGSFGLVDPINMTAIEKDRLNLVAATNFVQGRVSLGQLKIVASDFPDVATQEDWDAYLKDSDGDVELAIAAFRSQYEDKEVQDEEKPASKGKRTAKKAE